MDISVKLKERFCKDYKIPINLFQEPYFTERINLYDKVYGTISKYERFINAMKKYSTEQDYFEEYNRTKDVAIDFIKGTEAYQRFNTEDMNKFAVDNRGISKHDIFKPSNDGKLFISIDMVKANFSALSHYDSSIFGGAETWEEFISRFTNNDHIINSKYIRQVILGNCNPKRHITYERYLMSKVLYILENCKYIDNVVFYNDDEIVLDMSNNFLSRYEFEKFCRMFGLVFPLRFEYFTLHKIGGIDGYAKCFRSDCGAPRVEFKCIDGYSLPFIMRKYLGEVITENDKVFYHNGYLAKYIEIPNVELRW